MKNKITFRIAAGWLACLALTLGCISIARAQDEDPANKELAVIYTKLETLVQQKDAKGVAAYWSDDYTADDPDGKTMKRAEAYTTMEQAYAQLGEITSVKLKITALEQVEGNYIADVTGTIVSNVTGPDGKEHEIVAVVKARDWWIKTDTGAWKNIHSEEKGSTITIDGKPVGE